MMSPSSCRASVWTGGWGGEDANEPAIIAALKGAGYKVEQLTPRGDPGRPDLKVSHGEFWVYVEVKTPKGRLSGVQRWWHRKSSVPVLVVTTPEEAVMGVRHKFAPGQASAGIGGEGRADPPPARRTEEGACWLHACGLFNPLWSAYAARYFSKAA